MSIAGAAGAAASGAALHHKMKRENNSEQKNTGQIQSQQVQQRVEMQHQLTLVDYVSAAVTVMGLAIGAIVIFALMIS